MQVYPDTSRIIGLLAEQTDPVSQLLQENDVTHKNSELVTSNILWTLGNNSCISQGAVSVSCHCLSESWTKDLAPLRALCNSACTLPLQANVSQTEHTVWARLWPHYVSTRQWLIQVHSNQFEFHDLCFSMFRHIYSLNQKHFYIRSLCRKLPPSRQRLTGSIRSGLSVSHQNNSFPIPH